jgi:hypothetical protein
MIIKVKSERSKESINAAGKRPAFLKAELLTFHLPNTTGENE